MNELIGKTNLFTYYFFTYEKMQKNCQFFATYCIIYKIEMKGIKCLKWSNIYE